MSKKKKNEGALTENIGCRVSVEIRGEQVPLEEARLIFNALSDVFKDSPPPEPVYMPTIGAGMFNPGIFEGMRPTQSEDFEV